MFLDKYISLKKDLKDLKEIRALLRHSCFINNVTATIERTNCNY